MLHKCQIISPHSTVHYQSKTGSAILPGQSPCEPQKWNISYTLHYNCLFSIILKGTVVLIYLRIASTNFNDYSPRWGNSKHQLFGPVKLAAFIKIKRTYAHLWEAPLTDHNLPLKHSLCNFCMSITSWVRSASNSCNLQNE